VSEARKRYEEVRRPTAREMYERSKARPQQRFEFGLNLLVLAGVAFCVFLWVVSP